MLFSFEDTNHNLRVTFNLNCSINCYLLMSTYYRLLILHKPHPLDLFKHIFPCLFDSPICCKTLLILVQALAGCLTGKTSEERRNISSFLSRGMSSHTGLESQFSPGISSQNRPSESMFEASQRKSKTQLVLLISLHRQLIGICFIFCCFRE